MSNPDDTQPSHPEASPPPRPEASPPYQPIYPPTPAAPPAPTVPQAAAAPPPPPPPPIPPVGPPTVPMAATPPPGVPPRAVARHARESRRRSLGALAVACFLTLAAVLGYSIGANHGSNSTSASNSFPTQQQTPQFNPGSGQSSNGSGGTGSSSSGQQANIDVQSIAQKISPSVVNLVSSLSQGEAAGTGIVISSSGLVLTNNHVISGTTDLQAELNGNGQYHAVKVLGYDIEHDVALVQIQGVSNLTAASLGDSSSVQAGDAVVALGNAGGKGGDPTVVSGSVTATGQQITAADQDGSHAETLRNLTAGEAIAPRKCR